MFETASDEILFLDSKTIESMKSVPFFDEWIKASCEPLTDEESHDSWQLFYKEYEGKKLSNAEKVYKKYPYLNFYIEMANIRIILKCKKLKKQLLQ